MNKRIKNFVRKITIKLRHKKYHKIRVKNEDVTILSNCCIGGTMYNDLGLKFLSPTVNLFFGHHGFIDFINHLDEYRDAELHDLIDEYASLPYPKIIFTDLPSDSKKSLLHMSVYDKYDQNKKSVTSFINIFGKRGYDEFDFVNTIFNHKYEEQ